VLEVAHHLGTHVLRDGGVLERASHHLDPRVALGDADAELHVAHAQPRVSLAPAVVAGTPEVLDQELGLVANRLLEVLGEHAAERRMTVDSPVERARDAPEGIGTPKALEDAGLRGIALVRLHGEVS
jgi:hypothetical protein